MENMRDRPIEPGKAMLHAKSQNITPEKLKRYLPKGTAHKVTDNIMDMIDYMERDTGLMQEHMEETVLTQLGVLEDMKKTDLVDYVNAVKYCMLKRNMSNIRAWEIVFPERMERLLQMKLDRGDKSDSVNIDSHVSNYNKTEIVVALDTRMAVPPDILYAPAYHEAMMKKLSLMRGVGARPTDRVSAKVQLDAAIAITAIAAPRESDKIELQIGMSDEARSVQQNLADQLSRMADSQMRRLEAGESIEDVQVLGISTEAVLVEEDE